MRFCYLDSSCIVKRYLVEKGSLQVNQLISQAEITSTVLIARVEVAAAFAKAVRTQILTHAEAIAALELFTNQWMDYARLQITESTTAQAAELAWKYGLRGYDAVHLASAMLWQETLGEPVTLATFDRPLWETALRTGLEAWPESLEYRE